MTLHSQIAKHIDRRALRGLGAVLGVAAFVATGALGGPAMADEAAGQNGSPGAVFEGVDVKNKLGQQVDLEIPLIAPDGSTVTLADFLDGQSAVVLTLNFYRCTSICSEQLNSLVRTMVDMGSDWAPGTQKYRIVTVSFDPRDDFEVAAGKQLTYRKELVRLLAERDELELSEAQIAERAAKIDWTFLVAREKAIKALLDNVGYSVRWDEPTQQFAHSPVTYVLTPEGKIGRYLWNLLIPPNDLMFALMESSQGKLGSTFEKVLLSCFVYKDGQYAIAWSVMRIGGGIIVVTLGLWLFMHFRREKKRSAHLPLLNRSESRT